MFSNDRTGLRRLPAALAIRRERTAMHPPRPLPDIVWTSTLGRSMDWLRRVLLRR
ncbi:MAG: hypothetical protein IPP44_12650 [Ideonella sp.]|nr:hypothetical protein [Ideonella sp.]